MSFVWNSSDEFEKPLYVSVASPAIDCGQVVEHIKKWNRQEDTQNGGFR
jgi:hypothetical protein